MVLNKYLLAAMFAVNSICLAGGVMAAVPPGTAAPTANDIRQDADQTAQDVAGAIKNEKQDVASAKNASDIATLTGNQTFTLQLVGILMPLLSLLATGMIAYFQYKARNERHAMAEETRSNLGQLGRSINGMKTEVVAATKAAAFAAGAAHGAAAVVGEESIETLKARAAQLMKEAQEASDRAARMADEAVKHIETKPPNSP